MGFNSGFKGLTYMFSFHYHEL